MQGQHIPASARSGRTGARRETQVSTTVDRHDLGGHEPERHGPRRGRGLSMPAPKERPARANFGETPPREWPPRANFSETTSWTPSQAFWPAAGQRCAAGPDLLRRDRDTGRRWHGPDRSRDGGRSGRRGVGVTSACLGGEDRREVGAAFGRRGGDPTGVGRASTGPSDPAGLSISCQSCLRPATSMHLRAGLRPIRSVTTSSTHLKAGPSGGRRPSSGPAAPRWPPGSRPHPRYRGGGAITNKQLGRANQRAGPPGRLPGGPASRTALSSDVVGPAEVIEHLGVVGDAGAVLGEQPPTAAGQPTR
jgi:hypothetical protein